MSDMFELFLRMLIIGVAVAAPVGAMAILVIQRTVGWGWRAGLSTGLGIATADAMFAAVAAFGITAISEWLVSFQTPLRILGGLGLLWLGWRAFATRPAADDGSVPDTSTPHAKLFATAVGLTLTNPMTIIAFAAIFAGAGLVSQPGVTSAIVVTTGVAVGSLLWWLVLVSGVAVVRHAVNERTMRIINRISGLVLVAFGVLALVSGLAPLWETILGSP